jgi:hypothetical protein
LSALRLPGEPFLHADFAGAGVVPVVDMHLQHAQEMARVRQSAVILRLYSKVSVDLLAELVSKEEYTVAAQVRSAPADKQLARWLKHFFIGFKCRSSLG